MNKEEIKKWLQNNKDKSEEEIKTFLLPAINKDEFGEAWTKDYFLEDLKNPNNGLSKNALEVISEIQKNNKKIEIKEKKDKEDKNKDYFIPSFIFALSTGWMFGLFGLIFNIIGCILGFWIAKKMLHSDKDYIKIIFWILLILFFLGGTIIRTVQKESIRSSIINEY
jgi:hypothetical protein